MSGASSDPLEQCEALFVELQERYEQGDVEPEAFFAEHPAHGDTLRRWWQLLIDAGGVATTPHGTRFGSFELIRLLGSGAQGYVHLAEQAGSGRRVALKILPVHRALRAGAVGRFEREANVAARLDHPGICSVYESGEHDGAAYIAMQYLEGETLSARVTGARERQQPIAVERALRWGMRLAEALHAAHQQGLVHRDVKPGNVMITGDDRPVLLDFGLAYDRDDDSDLTRTGDVIGTPAYMSPEQLQGGRVDIDARADVYALGVILFEVLTLRRPFQAPTQEQLHRQILAGALPDVRELRPELSRDLQVVLQTAMARDRVHRYETAAAFADDLQRLHDGEPVLARLPGPVARLWSWCRRSPALAASLGLLIVSLAAGAIVGFTLFVEAQSARLRYDQLADFERLRDARLAAESARGGEPDGGARIDRWLREHGEPLARTLVEHRRALRELERVAVAIEPGDEPSAVVRARIDELSARLENSQQTLIRPRNAINRELHTVAAEKLAVAIEELRAAPMPTAPRFDNPEDAFVYRELRDLVNELEAFVATDGLLQKMRADADWERRVHDETIVRCREAWQRVNAELATDERFAGRRLSPQLGLVPIGRDPRSGLQEFAFARGGGIPKRHADTRELSLTSAHAPVFVLLPPGSFVAGSADDEADEAYDPDAKDSEKPQITVELDWFFVCKHELSRAQWQRLGGAVDSFCLDEDTLGPTVDMHPMTEISWQESRALLEDHRLLFPTELQWEYAARAGVRTRYLTGQDWRRLNRRTNFRGPVTQAAGEPVDGYRFTAPIDTLMANGFGLWHVSGNAAEFCRESFMNLAYTQAQRRPGDAELRVTPSVSKCVRGASFTAQPALGRLAARAFRPEQLRFFVVGLRPTRAVDF